MNEALKNLLKRCCDFIAGLTLFYPAFIMLLYTYQNEPSGPLTVGVELSGAAMGLTLPALIWLWWRQFNDPPGSHPILNKLVNKPHLMTRCVVAYVGIFYILHTAIQLWRITNHG